MSRHRRRKKINEIVMLPDNRRLTEPNFRGSTIDGKKCHVIDIGENFTIRQLVDTYAATENCDYTAYTRTCRAYVIEKSVIRVQSAAIDMDSISDEPGCLLVFRNCILTDKTGNMSLAVSGAGIAFENCTFSSAGKVNMTLGAGTSVVLDRCALYNTEMVAVRGTGDNDVSLKACGMMTGVLLLNRVGRIGIKGELPHSVAVDTAEKVSITGITKPSTGSTMALARIANEIYLEHCQFKRGISIYKSMCSIRIHDSVLDEMNITGSIVDGFVVMASAIHLLIGYKSVISGGVEYGGTSSIDCSAPTNCLGFPEVPMTMYKKVMMRVHSMNPFGTESTIQLQPVILRLSVPGNAQKHYTSGYRKFRVSEAKVDEVLDLEGNPIALPKYRKYELESLLYSHFHYEVGKTAYPEFPFDNSDTPCTSGIHGFAELQTAAEYS